MKLIAYKSTVDGAVRQGKTKGSDTDTLCLVDIAHSLSILAEDVARKRSEVEYERQRKSMG